MGCRTTTCRLGWGPGRLAIHLWLPIPDCRGPVSWRSHKQESVALSTAEAEYIALSSAAQEAEWIRRLVSELGNGPKGPTTILKDNQPAIAMAKNSASHAMAKNWLCET